MVDSSTSSTQFPKLNDTNYATWAMMMEAELVRKKLWLVVDVQVDGSDTKNEEELKTEMEKKLAKRSATTMAEARAEMILRVEGGQLSHMLARDPRDVWMTLESVHRARGFATSLSLKRRFLTAKKGAKQTMQSWIGDVRAQQFELGHVGVTVTEQDMILALTMGLPSSYDGLIIVFDSTPSAELTLETVISRLINEETRQSSLGTIRTERTIRPKDVADEAMAVTSKRHVDPADVTCFFCDKKGHFKSNCEEKKAWEERKNGKDTAAVVLEDDDDDDDVWDCT